MHTMKTKEQRIEFIKNYTNKQLDVIQFKWNGKYGDEFLDANATFRWAVIETVLDTKNNKNLVLLRDLFLEECRYSEKHTRFANDDNFYLLAAELLSIGKDKYLDEFLSQYTSSREIQYSYNKMELDIEVLDELLDSINARLQKGVAETVKHYLIKGKELFTGLKEAREQYLESMHRQIDKRLLGVKELNHSLFHAYTTSNENWYGNYYDEINHCLFDSTSRYYLLFDRPNSAIIPEQDAILKRIENEDPTVHLLPVMPDGDRLEFMLKFIEAQSDQVIKTVLLKKFHEEKDIFLDWKGMNVCLYNNWLREYDKQDEVAKQFEQQLYEYCLPAVQTIINEYQLDKKQVYAINFY